MTRLELKTLIANYGFSYRKIAEFTGDKLTFTYLSELLNGNKPLSSELTNRILTAIYRTDEKRTNNNLKES